MKRNNFFRTTLMLLLIFSFSCVSLLGQTNSEACELIFYRPAQGAMSGGAGADLKIYINDQEVGTLANGTVLKYSVFSEGNLKIKFTGIMMGSTTGQPKVLNVDVAHGKTIEFSTSINFPKGADAVVLEKPKDKEKMKKEKWADTMEGKEDLEKPLIVK